MKKLLCVFCALLLLGIGAYVLYDRHVHTPEYALREIGAAIAARDAALFEEYVDADALLADMHENASALLADHIQELHERHPADWFFRHDAAFMRAYMAERRVRDVEMACAMLAYYFDDARVPVTREDGAARWGSDELRAFAAHYAVSAAPADMRADEAEITCRLRGDESTYGSLLSEGVVRLRFTRSADDGRWRLTGMRTEAEDPQGLFALVDAAERYWALQGWD